MKLTREQAVAFVKKQMDDRGGESGYLSNKKGGWHYGWCDIQVLLDQIYGIDSEGEIVSQEVPM